MTNLPIKYKLFVLLFGLTGGVVAVILFATNRTVTDAVQDGVVNNFSRTQTFLSRQQRLRYDRLVESAYLISENSTFKANVSLNDPPTMAQSVQRFSRFVKADLMIVTNRTGKVLSWLGAPERRGTMLMRRKGVRMALSGKDPPLEIQLPTLWAIDQALYQVVTIPIYSGGDVIGTLTLGARFTEVEAEQLRQDSTMQVSLFLENQRIASTLPDTASRPYSALWSEAQERVERVVRERASTTPFRLTVRGREHFAFLSPLGEGEPAFYVASVPVDTELGTLYSLRQNILLIAVIAALLTIPLAIFLGGIVSGPIETLQDAMGQVEDGDLDVEVAVESGDEIGRLAHSFNEMIADLRERSLLQRHVGAHTLQMIRDSEALDVDLADQGQMQNLAVMFTDLRGSTDQIEHTEPREFVRQLNRTFSTQAKIATHFDGSIDKFVGDAMITIFAGEAPLERALQCSVEIQHAFRTDPLSSTFWRGLGIGVNYGPMLMGNMGTEERLDYSVIGAEVNLCARLCDAAAPGQILVRRDLIKEYGLTDTVQVAPVDTQTFKGFDRQFEIAEVTYDSEAEDQL